MSDKDALLSWASSTLELPQRKLDFLILGLPWDEAYLLSSVLVDLRQDIHVDLFATLVPAPQVRCMSSEDLPTSPRVVTKFWDPQSLFHKISQVRSPISHREGPTIDNRSAVVFDGTGAYAAALNNSLRPHAQRYAGAVLRSPIASREFEARVTSDRHVHTYQLDQALSSFLQPNRQGLQPVFDKIVLLLGLLNKSGATTVSLPNSNVLVFGDGALTRICKTWIQEVGANVQSLPVYNIPMTQLYSDAYLEAVSQADIIVVAELRPHAPFLAEAAYYRRYRDGALLVNMASTVRDFGYPTLSALEIVREQALPDFGRLFSIQQLSGGDRKFILLSDGHPMVSPLMNTQSPGVIVRALLMAAGELLTPTQAGFSIYPSAALRQKLTEPL